MGRRFDPDGAHPFTVLYFQTFTTLSPKGESAGDSSQGESAGDGI